MFLVDINYGTLEKIDSTNLLYFFYLIISKKWERILITFIQSIFSASTLVGGFYNPAFAHL